MKAETSFYHSNDTDILLNFYSVAKTTKNKRNRDEWFTTQMYKRANDINACHRFNNTCFEDLPFCRIFFTVVSNHSY